MTAARVCEQCGAALDAGEICDCEKNAAPLEFELLTDMRSFPRRIDFNFEALRDALAERLELYRGLVVTEDGIKGAKEDRARLNKLRAALEAKRKEIKKECMAPYTDFEAKVKELVGLIDQPIAAIDAQLKEYEEKRRAEKREAALAIYEETIGSLRTVLPFERVWQEAWGNAGTSMRKVRESILAVEANTVGDLKVLSTVEGEFSDAVRLKYLETLSLTEALRERARLQDQVARLREYERQQARAAEAAEAASEGDSPQAERECPAEQEETVYLLRFECQVTRDQARELSAWLRARNINYRRL